MFCKFCGQQVDDNAFACTNCGAILKTVEQPAQPAQPAQQSVQQPAQPAQPTQQPVQQPVYEQPAQPVQPVQQPAYDQFAYTQPYAQQGYAQPAPKPVVPREPMTEEKKQKLFTIFTYIAIGLICATVMFYLLGIGGIYYDTLANYSYSQYAVPTDILNIGWGAYVGFVWSIFGVGAAVVAFVFGLKCKEKDNKMLCIFLLGMTTALFIGGIGLMCL